MHILSVVTMLVILFFTSSSVFADLSEKELIDFVKNSMASDLDDSLPNIKIEKWVTKYFERGSEVIWEHNDCGEGWDISDPKSPVCVEIQIPHNSGYVLHINTIVNFDKKPYELEKWMIYYFKRKNKKYVGSFDVKTIKEALQLYKTTLEGK